MLSTPHTAHYCHIIFKTTERNTESSHARPSVSPDEDASDMLIMFVYRVTFPHFACFKPLVAAACTRVRPLCFSAPNQDQRLVEPPSLRDPFSLELE